MNVELALVASPPTGTAASLPVATVLLPSGTPDPAARPLTTAGHPLADQLTVVLLTYNCGHRLDRVLDQLLALGLPVIAVDNGSGDDTVARLTERPGVEVVALEQNIGAAGRNAGLDRARTPYVMFCDDDGWWDPDGLDEAVKLFEQHPRLAVINARILVRDEARLDPISVEMADSPLEDHSGVPGAVLLSFMAGAVIVRRSAYDEVGGYDPVFFLGGEEETLAVKLARRGWQMRYIPVVVMRHHPSVANAPKLRAFGMRNTLWNAWLHRRLPSAVRWTLFTLADTPKNEDWLRGVRMAVRGAGWVLRARRPIDAALDDALSVLDRRRFAARRGVLNRIDPIKHRGPSVEAPPAAADGATD